MHIKTKYQRKATALIEAAGSGHEVIVRLLLERGTDIEAHNYYQATALMEAAGSRHEAIV